MSVANIIVQGDRAHLLSDSGFWHDDGRLASLQPKVIELPKLRAAISTRGYVWASELQAEIEHAAPRTIAALLAKLPECVIAAEAAYCRDQSEREKSSVYMVYYDPIRQRCAGAFLTTRADILPTGYSRYTVIPVTDCFAPGCNAREVLGRDVDVRNPASFDPIGDGLQLVAAQRRDPIAVAALSGSGAAAGDIRLTTVSAAGVSTRVIGGWPDVVGERIAL